MKQFILLIHGLVFCFSSIGQSSYFNRCYLPPFENLIFGETTQLVESGDTLITAGFYSSGNYSERCYSYIDLQGDSLKSNELDENQTIQYTGRWSALGGHDGGYYFATTDISTLETPLFLSLDSNFREIWRYAKPELVTDSSTSIFEGYTQTQDGNILCFGTRIFNPDLNVVNDNYSHIILAKLSPEGNELWFKELDVTGEAFVSGFNQLLVYMRSSINELDNGDFLLWGTIATAGYHAAVVKVDSDGNFIAGTFLETGSENSYVPVSLPLENNRFFFSHTQGYGSDSGGENRKIRCGIFDADAMSFQWFPAFEHLHYDLSVTNIIRLANGDFCLLGGGYVSASSDLMGYMLRTDSLGNEIWWNVYYPPSGYYHGRTYDLVETPDQGLAFLGSVYKNEIPLIVCTWVVKTDACGDTQNLGCPLGVEEMEKNSLVTLYPNPTCDVLHVTLADQNFSEVSLCNLLGETLQTHNLRGLQNATFNTSNLSPGVYMVKLKRNSGEVVVRAVVCD
jgi:Secretion system C-terminal sorting domain